MGAEIGSKSGNSRSWLFILHSEKQNCFVVLCCGGWECFQALCVHSLQSTQLHLLYLQHSYKRRKQQTPTHSPIDKAEAILVHPFPSAPSQLRTNLPPFSIVMKSFYYRDSSPFRPWHFIILFGVAFGVARCALEGDKRLLVEPVSACFIFYGFNDDTLSVCQMHI